MEKLMPKNLAARIAIALLIVAAIWTLMITVGARDARSVDRYDIDQASGRLAWDKANGCAEARLRLLGGNAILMPVVSAHVTVNWCWRNGKVRKEGFRVDRWGQAHYVWWSYDGVSATVRGGDVGGSHVYRRFYFKFVEGVAGYGLTYTPWISFTVRGDGSCNMDREGLDPGSVECGAVAGGGGGGGSW